MALQEITLFPEEIMHSTAPKICKSMKRCFMYLPRWCLHLNVVGEFASFCEPESYASGSVATGRVTQAGQVKG